MVITLQLRSLLSYNVSVVWVKRNSSDDLWLKASEWVTLESTKALLVIFWSERWVLIRKIWLKLDLGTSSVTTYIILITWAILIWKDAFYLLCKDPQKWGTFILFHAIENPYYLFEDLSFLISRDFFFVSNMNNSAADQEDQQSFQ